jgi:hypothetical protein
MYKYKVKLTYEAIHIQSYRVFVGILSALTRMDKKVKTAWTEAMSGPQGE